MLSRADHVGSPSEISFWIDISLCSTDTAIKAVKEPAGNVPVSNNLSWTFIHFVLNLKSEAVYHCFL